MECFHRNRARPDGLDHYCKDCRRPYGKTEAARASCRRWHKTPKGREAVKRWSDYGAQRAKVDRRKNPEKWRAYANKRYRELYAPGAPRHVKRPNTWKPSTAEHRQRRRDKAVISRRKYNRTEKAKKKARARLKLPTVQKRNRERTRAYMKRRRREDPQFVKKEAARTMANLALRHGWLTRGPCRDCGTTEKIQAHHPDYDRPLDVVWLCPTHHLAEHHPHLKETAGTAHVES